MWSLHAWSIRNNIYEGDETLFYYVIVKIKQWGGYCSWSFVLSVSHDITCLRNVFETAFICYVYGLFAKPKDDV